MRCARSSLEGPSRSSRSAGHARAARARAGTRRWLHAVDGTSEAGLTSRRVRARSSYSPIALRLGGASALPVIRGGDVFVAAVCWLAPCSVGRSSARRARLPPPRRRALALSAAAPVRPPSPAAPPSPPAERGRRLRLAREVGGMVGARAHVARGSRLVRGRPCVCHAAAAPSARRCRPFTPPWCVKSPRAATQRRPRLVAPPPATGGGRQVRASY